MSKTNNRKIQAYRMGRTVQPLSPIVRNAPTPKERKSLNLKKMMLFIVVLAGIALIGYRVVEGKKVIAYNGVPSTIQNNSSPKPQLSVAVNPCASNSLAKNVVVVISRQHLYACSYSQVVFNSAVITGYDGDPSDITPVGTYSIFKKFTNVNLSGSDELGSWNVHVSYWMPFLFNQFGAYGFHDATWRTPNDFGNISPSSTNASHGCVECPLATARWLYSWLDIGTTVIIENQA